MFTVIVIQLLATLLLNYGRVYKLHFRCPQVLYCVEKLVLNHLIFLLIKISQCQLVPNAILFHIICHIKILY